MVGDSAATAGEEARLAAVHELEEETGYVAGDLKFLLSGPTSPDPTSEVISLYLATNLRKTGAGGVDGKNITLHRVPLTVTG
jgi:ADP-ribose pyrophosphatase